MSIAEEGVLNMDNSRKKMSNSRVLRRKREDNILQLSE